MEQVTLGIKLNDVKVEPIIIEDATAVDRMHSSVMTNNAEAWTGASLDERDS
jgi:hypothetical protein